MKNIGIRITGFLIFMFCLLGMATTIILGIAKDVSDLSNLNLVNIAYILTVCFSGIIIFSSNCYITAIRKQYHSHYSKVVILRTGLLIFMVYNNYHFFTNNIHINNFIDKFMYFLLCILMDLSIITFLPFAFDRMTLNFTYKNDDNENDKSIIGMLIHNLTFGWKNQIEQTYKRNLQLKQNPSKFDLAKTLKEVEIKEVKEHIKQLEEKPELKLLKGGKSQETQITQENKTIENVDIDSDSSDAKEPETLSANDLKNETEINSDLEDEKTQELVSANDIEKILKAIIENKKGNVAPSVPKLEQLTGLKKTTVQAAKRELEKQGLIKTVTNKTFVQEVENVSKTKDG